jgi:hypothetical protein
VLDDVAITAHQSLPPPPARNQRPVNHPPLLSCDFLNNGTSASRADQIAASATAPGPTVAHGPRDASAHGPRDASDHGPRDASPPAAAPAVPAAAAVTPASREGQLISARRVI